MSDDFYKAFEDKHRGSRGLIKSRLTVYLPFISPLKEIYEDSHTMDLGCGRGEWLELLTEQGGFDAHGVDLDEGMLALCEVHKLQYTLQDALSCLNSLEDESQSVVTAFHLAEHIPFADLQNLVQQALRVLKPAGLLILETPNPENIVVGTAEFYMDPTHNQPLPPNLLAFLPDYYGFQKTKIVRLQESEHLKNSNEVQLIDVLKGVSQDYAVIAQKKASEETLSKFTSVFSKTYGVTLDDVAERYKQKMIRDTQEKTQVIEAKIQATDKRIQAAEARSHTAEERITALLNSKSWQYTKPIRQCITLMKRLFRTK